MSMFGNGRIREIAGAGQRESEYSVIGAGCSQPFSARKRGTICANYLSNPVRMAGQQTQRKYVGVGVLPGTIDSMAGEGAYRCLHHLSLFDALLLVDRKKGGCAVSRSPALASISTVPLGPSRTCFILG